MKKKYPNEKVQVELPKSLRGNTLIYSPQNQHLEGYSQMPRMITEPYSNQSISASRDIVKRKHFKES